MVQREYIRELESTEQDIRQALDHIDHERAAIQEIREHGGNAQTAEALSTRVGVSGKRYGAASGTDPRIDPIQFARA
jgi:hypothetical protein